MKPPSTPPPKAPLNTRPQLIITSGEPAGIGPDLLCALFATDQLPDADYWVLGDPQIFKTRAQSQGLLLEVVSTPNPAPFKRGYMPIKAITHPHRVTPGQPCPNTAPYVFAQLQEALRYCQKTQAALVTCPLDKSIQAQQESDFRGHTDYLAMHTHTPCVTMMLAAGDFRVALATTHVPFREILKALTPEALERTIVHTHQALRDLFGIAHPRIGICGLNPHAGDQGLLGLEEKTLMQPILDRLQKQGLCLSQPLSPDSAFTEGSRRSYDAFIALYHDQGLIPIKTLSFDRAVNLTLNLPFIRTSVDHGTAYALAGTAKGSHESLKAAIQLAYTLQKNRV